MIELRGWLIYAWIGLPTVMYGGYALLGLVARDALTPHRRTWFRAGHAHAGVLLLAFLLFVDVLARTDLGVVAKNLACAAFVLGILAQSGGFFVHMVRGQEGASTLGTRITSAGALVLGLAIAVLVYGLATVG